MSKLNGFPENAELYATSNAHSQMGDLELALERLGDPDGLTILDIATGTGHVAFFFAERFAHVFAIDINDRVLAVAQEESDRKSLSCRFMRSLAEDLPFDDDSFDVVCCRLGAHHFSSLSGFLSESWRVLRPHGHLLLIDNVVPDEDAETRSWINDYAKERDSTHVACLSVAAWRELLKAHGYTDLEIQNYPKSLDFDIWMQRKAIETDQADRLWQKLLSAPDGVKAYLKPRDVEGRQLTLQRAIMAARKPQKLS